MVSLGILINCEMLCPSLPLFLLSPTSGTGTLPRMPTAVTRENRAAPLTTPAAHKGRAQGRLLPPRGGEGLHSCRHHESARWDSKTFHHMCVSIVLDKTFFKALACGMGMFPLRFPCCHVQHTRAEGWCAWGFGGFNPVQRALRKKTEHRKFSKWPSFEAQQVISALECGPGLGH